MSYLGKIKKVVPAQNDFAVFGINDDGQKEHWEPLICWAHTDQDTIEGIITIGGKQIFAKSDEAQMQFGCLNRFSKK